MRIEDTALPEVKIVRLDLHGDARGFFVERYTPQLESFGPFVQDNHSHSAPGVIRGLHFQHDPMQGKLVGVTRGHILDVAVDVRPASPDFGKHVAVELNEATLLWMPAGFAHGFCVLGNEPADVCYKVTGVYNAAGEGGIRFDDPQLAIAWPVSNPTVSERDRALPLLEDALLDVHRWFA